MIKATKYVRINILTVLMFIICYLTGSFKILCVSYAVMTAHELAHTLAAVCIGLKISHISFQPFGVNLRLKNKMIYSLSDEIILYMSGPLVNVLFALTAMIVYNFYFAEIIRQFYISNIILFAMNMLPAIPLDGGIILKKILSYVVGEKATVKIMKGVSVVISAALLLIGCYVLYVTRLNFSILVFSALMMGNLFTQSEKYDVDFVKELMFHTKKINGKVKHIIASENSDYCDIAKMLDKKSYYIIYLTNTDGEIKNIITENQLISRLLQ